MKSYALGLLAIGLAACAGEHAEPARVESELTGGVRGRVATIVGESATFEEVPLTPFTGAPFENALVHMRALPANVTPDASGCYCFGEADDRFAIPHAYEHATRALRTYNERLAELALPPVSGVGIEIRKAPTGVFSTGSMQNDPEPWAYVESSSPVVDTSMLVHEIGHVIDARVRLPNDPPTALSSRRVPLALSEVFANLLSVLYLGIPTFASYAWKDAALDMTIALRSPDQLISERVFFQRMVDAPRFASAFPVSAGVFREALATSASGQFDGPDSYSSSAIVVGPMLSLAGACGYDSAQRIALAAIHDLGRSAGVGDYAARLVAQSHATCATSAARLESSFREAGLL